MKIKEFKIGEEYFINLERGGKIKVIAVANENGIALKALNAHLNPIVVNSQEILVMLK